MWVRIPPMWSRIEATGVVAQFALGRASQGVAQLEEYPFWKREVARAERATLTLGTLAH